MKGLVVYTGLRYDYKVDTRAGRVYATTPSLAAHGQADGRTDTDD